MVSAVRVFLVLLLVACVAATDIYFPGGYVSTLGGRDWDPSDPSCKGTSVGSGKWELRLSGLPESTYLFKVTVGPSWSENYGVGGHNGDNVEFTASSDVVVILKFDDSTKEVTWVTEGAPPTPPPTPAPSPSATSLRVEMGRVANTVPRAFLGHGQFLPAWIDGCDEGKWQDTAFRNLVAQMAPFTLRVGGVTGPIQCNVTFSGFGNEPARALSRSNDGSRCNKVFTLEHWHELRDFARSVGAKVIFQFDDLVNRPCPATQGGGGCSGSMDAEAMEGFVATVARTWASDRDWLLGFEMSNEVMGYGHGGFLTPAQAAADLVTLKGIVESQHWGDAGSPALFGPSQDFCLADLPSTYLTEAGVVDALGAGAYTMHSYPMRDGFAPSKWKSPTWLREHILQDDQHAHIGECLKAGHAAGLRLMVTETNSVYGWNENMRSLKNSFWYLASLGQFALVPGLQLHGRWTLSEMKGSSFSIVSFDPKTTRSSPNADYWIAVLHKRLVGTQILEADFVDVEAGVAYAACTHGASNGSITVTYALPGDQPLRLSPPAGDAWASHELYALTEDAREAPAGVELNAAPLAVTSDGALPAIDGRRGTGDVILPAVSVGFIVFPNAAVSVCRADQNVV